jgi:ubiquitin-protein ligase
MALFQSPRTRRLERDYEEMLQLKEQSSILDFEVSGNPPDRYVLTFKGGGLREEDGEVGIADRHQVEIKLGADYPRTLPQTHWLTPIVHPNISNGGPCLGAFGMTPNVRLTQIVEILWDMNRMAIYNPYSGYGQAKQSWDVLRDKFGFPVDKRILRNLAPPTPEPEDSGEPEMIMMGTLEWTPSTRYSKKPEALKAFITDWLRKHDLLYDTKVYTPDEWLARGEKYGERSLLTITTEGPLYDMMNDGWNPRLYEKFQAFLTSIGIWYELGYAWSIHLYPKQEG